MSILTELTESQLFSSKTSFRKHTAKELVEMLYLNILAFRILSSEKEEHDFIRRYAQKTKYYNGFDEWHFTNVTDLYLLVYGVTSGNVDLNHSTDNFLSHLTFDDKKFLLWIKAIATGDRVAESYATRFFLTLDNQLKMNNTIYRSIRRLAGNWKEIGHRDQKLAMTKLLQLMRSKSHSSDLLPKLEALARTKKLEIKDTSSTADDSTLMTYAAHQHKLAEDDGGAAAAPADVATTSSDIAPVVKPIGKVRRREG